MPNSGKPEFGGERGRKSRRRPHATAGALAPPAADADGLVRRDRLIGAGDPGGSRGELGRLHVDRIDLPAEEDHHLERHRDRAAAKTPPLAVADDQLDLALRVAHDLTDMPERAVVVI